MKEAVFLRESKFHSRALLGSKEIMYIWHKLYFVQR